MKFSLPFSSPAKALVQALCFCAAVLAVACGDPTRQNATYTSQLQSFTVFTLNGASASAPNALSFLTGVTRATSSFGFDVAFEIDASGSPVVYPARTLAGSLVQQPKRVGLLPLSGGFGALTEVPSTGYDTVTVQTLRIGQVVAVEVRDPNSCYSLNYLTPYAAQFLYSKFVVDSVNTTARLLYGRVVTDPNCGYRGVVPDSIPKN